MKEVKILSTRGERKSVSSVKRKWQKQQSCNFQETFEIQSKEDNYNYKRNQEIAAT